MEKQEFIIKRPITIFITASGLHRLSHIVYFKKYRRQAFIKELLSFLQYRFPEITSFRKFRVYDDTVFFELIFHGTEEEFNDEISERIQNAVNLFYRDWFSIQRDSP